MTHASFEPHDRVEYYALMSNFPVVSKSKTTKAVMSLNPQFKLSAPPLKSLKKPPAELVTPLSLFLPKK